MKPMYVKPSGQKAHCWETLVERHPTVARKNGEVPNWMRSYIKFIAGKDVFMKGNERLVPDVVHKAIDMLVCQSIGDLKEVTQPCLNATMEWALQVCCFLLHFCSVEFRNLFVNPRGRFCVEAADRKWAINGYLCACRLNTSET